VALRERKFGVEIECNMKKHPDYDGDGYRLYGRGSTSIVHNLLTKEAEAGRISRRWLRDIHCDGSGAEATSPKLSGAKGFAELKRVMYVLKSNGGAVNAQDGLHVHHDAPEFIRNTELKGMLADSWLNNEQTIQKLVAARRHGDRAYHCPPLSAKSVEIIKKGQYGGLARHSLNLRSLEKHGSIEFRLHEGTLDFDQAKAWIRFGQAFIESVLVRKRPIKPVGVAELLRIVGTAESAQRRLMSRRGAR